MNRKLHNTVMALIASSSLFVLGLLTASPAVPAFATSTSFTAVASLDSDHPGATEAAHGNVERAQANPHVQVRRPRQQSVAMPFYSFAPRG